MSALATELATYQRLLPTLLAEQGRWALIKGQSHAGTFDTYRDAITIGTRAASKLLVELV